MSNLAGISVDSLVSTGDHSFREQILFTHRGLSGPATLQISNYWRSSEPVSIDLLPATTIREVLRASGRKTVSNALGSVMPDKLVKALCPPTVARLTFDQLSEKDIEQLDGRLNSWPVRFKGTEGYDKAEVTVGGVSTDELSSQTMETRRVRGLFFIGEVVDVTGWLGGYNFQWAWASGYAAGQVRLKNERGNVSHTVSPRSYQSRGVTGNEADTTIKAFSNKFTKWSTTV